MSSRKKKNELQFVGRMFNPGGEEMMVSTVNAGVSSGLACSFSVDEFEQASFTSVPTQVGADGRTPPWEPPPQVLSRRSSFANELVAKRIDAISSGDVHHIQEEEEKDRLEEEPDSSDSDDERNLGSPTKIQTFPENDRIKHQT